MPTVADERDERVASRAAELEAEEPEMAGDDADAEEQAAAILADSDEREAQASSPDRGGVAPMQLSVVVHADAVVRHDLGGAVGVVPVPGVEVLPDLHPRLKFLAYRVLPARVCPVEPLLHDVAEERGHRHVPEGIASIVAKAHPIFHGRADHGRPRGCHSPLRK